MQDQMLLIIMHFFSVMPVSLIIMLSCSVWETDQMPHYQICVYRPWNTHWDLNQSWAKFKGIYKLVEIFLQVLEKRTQRHFFKLVEIFHKLTRPLVTVQYVQEIFSFSPSLSKSQYYRREAAMVMEANMEKMSSYDLNTPDSSVPNSQVQIISSNRRSWWGRRTHLEKRLFIIVILALAVLVAMVITIAVKLATRSSSQEGSRSSQVRQDQDVCMTSDCVKTSSRILEAMDDSIDPCDDFFEFACGAWNKKNVIPDDRASYNTFGKLKDELDVILKRLLETPIHDEDPNAIVQAKNVYQSCLNMTLIESRGEAPLRHIIHELGGWPVLDADWREDSFDIIDLMAKLRLFNNRVLINSWVSADDKNSNVNIIQLDQAQLGLPSRDYYLEGRDARPLVAYETFASDVAKMLGVDPDVADREMKAMIDFEVALANITVPEEERRDTEHVYNKFTVAELYTNLTDYIDWHRLINTIFGNVSIQINRTEDVVVYAPEYMKNLAQLLQNTPTRVLGNYMLWRIIMNRVNNMPQRYLDLRREFSKVLYGTGSDRARWRTCVNYVNDNFGMAVGRMFVQERFDEGAKSVALDMIHDIRKAFSELLEEVPWMDTTTREVAREKAEYIAEKIGYPDYVMNDTALNADYEGIVMDPHQYFENVLINLNSATRNSLKNLRKAVDKTDWSTTPAVVNAFYSAAKNQMMFPAGIFQPPFYHKSYPKSLNYGGIAMVIGHEITHGFDDKGRMFDKDGNLVQWWSSNVIESFKVRAQCIIDQYSNYTVPEVNMNLNGRQTQGENIADNGGLKQSFRAYRNWVSRRGSEEPLLPGLDYNHNQLFFMNFAQIWCGGARPESYIGVIRSSKHSPGRFRVIGTLSNSDDFAEAFKCPVGSRMNPRKKCSVW